MLSVSANGGAAGTGILWAALSRAGDANHTPQPGILRAYDAEQRDAGALEQPAERREGLARELLEVQPADRGEREGVRRQPVEQAGGLRTDWSSRRQHGAGSSALERIRTSRRPARRRLTGTATDDGNPVPPGLLTTTWSLVSGPASVTFSAPNALTTSATFPVPGTYTIRLSAFDGQVTASDDMIVVVAAPTGSGTGLLAQYFNDAGSGIYFTALVLTRTDPTVDFDWASGAPDPAVQADNFSVRWSGQVMAPVTAGVHVHDDVGRRRPSLRQRAAAHRQLDGSRIDRRTAPPSRSSRIRWYDIRMDFYDHATLATARLSWAYPGQTAQVVPQWALYPAPAVNQPPTVDAGADKTITLPAAASLTGIARDDGLPGPSLTTTWSKISGREDSAGGTVTFGNPNAPVDHRDVRRRRHLRAAAHRERRRGDGQRRRDHRGQPRAAQHGAGRQRGGRPDGYIAGGDDARRHRYRRRASVPAGGADEELDQGERSGHGHLLELDVADAVRDVLGRGRLRAPPDRVRQRPHDVRRHRRHGESGDRQRPDGAVLQGSGNGHALHHARPHSRRPDGQLHVGLGSAGGRRHGRQLLGPLDRDRSRRRSRAPIASRRCRTTGFGCG